MKERASGVLVKTVMSMYDVAKARVRFENDLAEEFLVAVGVHQRSVLSPLLFSIVIYVKKKLQKKTQCVKCYIEIPFLLNDTMSDLREKFFLRKEF